MQKIMHNRPVLLALPAAFCPICTTFDFGDFSLMLQLHFCHPETGQLEALRLSQAVAVLVAHEPAQVLPQLQALAAWQARGYGAAGYIAYEAAAALAPELPCHGQADGLPLLWFAVFAPELLQAAPP